MKRILSLDIIRGIAIFFMVIVHTWMNIYNTDQLKNLDIETVNPFILIFGIFMFILGHSRTLFLLISAIIYSYHNYSRYQQGYDKRSLMGRNVATGVLLYLIGNIREAIFNPWGIIDEFWQTGEWDLSELRSVYLFETLQMIGIGVIIQSLTIYLLLEFQEKEGEPRYLSDKIQTITFAVLSVSFVLVAPWVRELTNTHLGLDSENDYNNIEGGLSVYVSRFFWVAIAGAQEPIFPYLGIVFLGAIVGYYLSKPQKTRRFIHNLLILGVVLIVSGLLYWAVLDDFSIDIWFDIHPTWFLVLNTGIHVLIIGFIFNNIEFNQNLDHDKIQKTTLFFRRWSMLSLTIYVYQIIDIIPREVFTQLLEIDFKTRGQQGLLWTLFMIGMMILIWEVILRVWERFGFVGSWEWLVLNIRNVFFDRSGLNSKKLDVNETLYNVEVIQFVEGIRDRST